MGRGNERQHSCHNTNLPEVERGRREQGNTIQCLEKEKYSSNFRASSWLSSKYSHDKAIQFSINSYTDKQLSALVSRDFCSGL